MMNHIQSIRHHTLETMIAFLLTAQPTGHIYVTLERIVISLSSSPSLFCRVSQNKGRTPIVKCMMMYSYDA